VNPVRNAVPPSVKAPNPHPLSPEDAARIINAAWEDPDWGAFVWLTMTTGSRRGEMCAIRWRHVDLKNAVLILEKSIGQDGAETFEKDTKTHQRRHLVLDPETVAILTEHWERCKERAGALDIELSRDGFVFSTVSRRGVCERDQGPCAIGSSRLAHRRLATLPCPRRGCG